MTLMKIKTTATEDRILATTVAVAVVFQFDYRGKNVTAEAEP